ncbi:MAG TPA: SDR family oxidoreductase [Ignavibacteriaceae bacterium]|jgi:3-oxoacyl-[acyl-carrier protein] reductase|nr:SDR family oxidoreductase [Ignavibacteriaceae bacterium]
MNLGIKGKTALITASSKGIGKAIAEGFAAEGCKVAVCARSKEELLELTNDLKKRYGIDAVWCICDINKPKEIESTVDAVHKELGSIDILVNNCGGPPAGYFTEFSDRQWQNAIDQVLMSAVRFIRLVLPDMISNEWGRIINITSITVKQPVDNLVLSNSLRTGVTGLAKTLSTEYAKYNVTVNNIAPGYTLTNRLYDLAVARAKKEKHSHEEILTAMAKDTPGNRLGAPEEIASAVLFLASKKASYINGITLNIDGGLNKSLFG